MKTWKKISKAIFNKRGAAITGLIGFDDYWETAGERPCVLWLSPKDKKRIIKTIRKITNKKGKVKNGKS